MLDFLILCGRAATAPDFFPGESLFPIQVRMRFIANCSALKCRRGSKSIVKSKFDNARKRNTALYDASQNCRASWKIVMQITVQTDIFGGAALR
jgi:hypothetical protein